MLDLQNKNERKEFEKFMKDHVDKILVSLKDKDRLK